MICDLSVKLKNKEERDELFSEGAIFILIELFLYISG